MNETQSGAGGKPKAPRLLKKTFTIAVVLYAVLIGSAFVPFVGMIVFILVSIVAYLWMYVGFLVACVTFVVGWLLARRQLKSAKQRLPFALLSGMIAFAVAGIVLMASFLCFRYDAHLIGFRLHTQIWLDAEATRDWAQNVEFVEGEYGLERRSFQVPWALWMVGLPASDVNLDPATRDVTVEQGGPLSGHWGVWVTAKGRAWDGVSNHLEDARHCEIEDGVWVFHTEH